MKVTGAFVILQSRDGFKCDPETKFQTITSYNQFRITLCTDVLQNKCS